MSPATSVGARQINELVSENTPWRLKQANASRPTSCTSAEPPPWTLGENTRPRYLRAPPSGYLPVGCFGLELPDVFALADVVISQSGR